ncbi:MAG: TetR family transcriptional regulator C-terminal domain-containing protein [Alphaproteobacteria bacterium]|nr:TetR family transcriptional regulator C-terminal domain-containing protein [Alphaproteobacteria bacterium]
MADAPKVAAKRAKADRAPAKRGRPPKDKGQSQVRAQRPGTQRAVAKEATRLKLIEATIDSIARSGFADTTLAKVSEGAGLSRGIVNFHFTSKDALLVETLTYLADEYTGFWRAAIEQAGTDPAAQLTAIIEAEFHPTVCNRKKIAVWYAFWGEARSRPTYLEVCERQDTEHLQTIRGICRALVDQGGYPEVDAEDAANGLMALTDGLWLDQLLTPDHFDREAARRVCRLFLAGVFPRHFTARAGAASAA